MKSNVFSFLYRRVAVVFFVAQLIVLQAEAQSPYPFFESWPIVNLKGGTLICSNYQTTFIDEFDDVAKFNNQWDKYSNDPYEGRFHCGAAANIFTDENVTLENGKLKLTVKEEPGYTLYPDPQSGSPLFNPHCYEKVPYVKRDVTAGMVQVREGNTFNLGKYEIRCKLPNKDHVWSTFWMWNHDEIDIMDIGFRSKILHNSINDTHHMSASIQESPCCPYFVDCSYCPTNSVDCTSAPNCQECGDWQCEYLASGFHTIGCEWTPFKIRFYVDGVTTGVVYRYYTLNRTPVDVDCGGAIPSGPVRENPAYISIEERGFKPIIWIAAEQKYDQTCNYEMCPANATSEDLPATLEVEYVKVEERVYERVSIVPGFCYTFCPGSTSPLCVTLESEVYNYIFDNIWAYNHFTPPAKATSWTIPAGNAVTLSATASKACFQYTGLDCSTSPCKHQLVVQATVQTHAGGTATITQKIESPQPKIIDSTIPGGPKRFCVYRDNYCNSYQVSINGGQPEVINDAEMHCYTLENTCATVDITFGNCGKTQIVTETIFSTTPNPAGFLNGNTTALQTVNFVPYASAYFCFPTASNPNLAVTGATVVGGSGSAAHSGNCVSVNIQNGYVSVAVNFTLNGCPFTKTYTLVLGSGHYKVSPNPTTGSVYLEVDTKVEQIEVPGEGTVEFSASPQHLRVFDSKNTQILELPLNEGTGNLNFEIPANAAPGTYRLEITDNNIKTPIILSLQKI